MKFILHFFIGILILLSSAAGADQVGKSVKALKIKEKQKPVIDGKLDEPEWNQAEKAADFLQFVPDIGAPANVKTQVSVLYTENHIYFGICCFDPEPGKLTARLTKRDSNLINDDAVVVGLDTFFDRRTAYYFFTNPLGTQLDGRLSDNGRINDPTWDGEWQSAAVTAEFGWTAEIAIPFSILKFQPGKNRNWGLGLIRFIPRTLEKDTWTGPVEAVTRVSQFGTLTALDLRKSTEKLEIIPHVITHLHQGEQTKLAAGIDARYAISQTVSANLTVNPDFATVEADQEVINLTRFEVQLPEKRNFFLEGSEIYNQPIRLFYSRRIADIHGGIKLYGKKGGYEFAAMTVQAKADQELDLEAANYSIFRLRKDIFKSSTIGLLAANKLEAGKGFGGVGLDFVHFFSERVSVISQMALSYGDHDKENIAFFIMPNYDTSTFHIHLRYTQLGENFADNVNHIGYIRDDDRHELDSTIEKTWWINKYGVDHIAYDSSYDIYWSKKGLLRSWQIDQQLALDLTNKFSFLIKYTREYKLYEKDFNNHSLVLSLGYNTREWQSARLQYEFGRNFDLDFKLYGAAFNYKLMESLSLEYELNRLFIQPDPQGESTWIHVLRLTNYFTKDLYFKFFYQTNTAIDKYNVQALLVYRYQPPFGTIQLAYQRGAGRFGEVGDQRHTLFLKISYVF